MLNIFDSLRATEYSHLDDQRLIYLDYTGAAIPSASQMQAQASLIGGPVLGNPHSEHGPSRASTELVEHARTRVLAFFGADPAEYAVCFTANTSAAIKLVGESFPFRRGSRLVLSADNHNSVNGVREFARRRGATVETVPLTAELRLDDPAAVLAAKRPSAPSLFAFPAQSNFSGVRHPLALIGAAQELGYRVLLDAAAFAPTSLLKLSEVKPDFVAMSFYKMFGFPTGVGALVVRHDALAELKRPWFAGGTVDWASVQHQRHQLRESVAAFEDGTPNYYGLAALHVGFDALARVEMSALSLRVSQLVGVARTEMTRAKHGNGAPIFRIYGPVDGRDQGGTIAVNLLDDTGAIVAYDDVEHAARRARVAVRGGCFCNPGASEAAFGFPSAVTRQCLSRASQGGRFTPRRFGECLGGDVAVGAIRISVGLPTSIADIVCGVEALVAAGRSLARAPRSAS